MRTTFTFASFHEQLVVDLFPQRPSDADSMLLFAILHNYRILVVPNAISDMPRATGFAAITQRHAASCLARLWRDTNDDRRDDAAWYWMWNTDWSYDRVESLAGNELLRFNEIKSLIENHPAVDSVILEDE